MAGSSVTVQDRAVEIAISLALRLRDPATLSSGIARVCAQVPRPDRTGWHPFSLSYGHTGLALTMGWLDACVPGEGWDAAAHEQLAVAARALEAQPMLHAGLFTGLSGAAFVGWYLAKGTRRYQRMLRALDARMLPGLLRRASALAARRDGVLPPEIDFATGLVGSAAYLLSRRESLETEGALREILRAVVSLSEEEGGVPRWHVPGRSGEAEAKGLPDGYVDCGLAHGAPGALALLARAYVQGVRVDGHDEAIVRVADWLLAHAADDEYGLNWPKIVAVPPPDGAAIGSASPSLRPARTAWCYGAPGVATALWAAGDALAEPRYRDAAVSAIRCVLAKPWDRRDVEAASFCHGVSGLLQTVIRVARNSGLADLERGVRDLLDHLIDLYDEALPFGYQSIEMGGVRADQPGLLGGAAGVVAVLLAASSKLDPTWDRAFLLS
jgi:hypothetical protein